MAKQAPYDFVFDYLPGNIIVKPMFGMYYIYLNKKLMLILRKAIKELSMNGIWISTLKEHHQSLEDDIPSLANFVLDNGEVFDSNWRLLKDGDDDFESAANHHLRFDLAWRQKNWKADRKAAGLRHNSLLSQPLWSLTLKPRWIRFRSTISATHRKMKCMPCRSSHLL